MAKIRPEKSDTEYSRFLEGVGERIKEYRQLKNMTQIALATQIGVSQSYYYLVETGRQNVSLYTIWLIATALGVTPDLLLSEGQIWGEPTRKSIEQLSEALVRMTDEHVKLAEQNANMTARMGELRQACGRLIDKLGRGGGIPEY